MSKYAEDIATIKQVVQTLPGRLDRISNTLAELNGEVSEHAKSLAALSQWKENHKDMHDDFRDRLSALNKRLWGFAGLNGLLTAVMTWLGR